MKSSIVAAAAAVALTAGTLGGSAQAATVFTDNFNSYPVMLNWVPPANWSATSWPLGRHCGPDRNDDRRAVVQPFSW